MLGKRTVGAIFVMVAMSAAIGMASCGDDDPGLTASDPDASATTDVAATSDVTTTSDAKPPVTHGPVDPGIAARAAVVLGACVPDDGVHRYLENMYFRRSSNAQTALIFHSALECLATKGNGCQAITDCLGITVDVVPTPADCVRGCTGNNRTGCDGRLRFVEDCTRYGEVCVAGADGGRNATCAPPGAPPCPRDDAGGYTFKCVDGKPSYCTGAVEQYGAECASVGMECKSGGCAGTGGACSSSSSSGGDSIDYSTGISCNAGTLQACVNGGVAAAECSSFATGFTCQSIPLDGGGARIICGLGSECTPPGRRNLQCDGDSVVVCNAGRIDRVDCKTLGFTGCSGQFGGCTPNLASIFGDGG